VVTETLMANGVTFKIERMQITDAGRFAIRGRMRTVVPSTGRNAAASACVG
jgi:hypothetical protein